MHAIPRIPPSRLYSTSPAFGSSRLTLCLYVNSDTNRTSERSRTPGLKFVVRRQTTPVLVQFGVECGQSTTSEHACSTVREPQQSGSSDQIPSSGTLRTGVAASFPISRHSAVNLPEHADVRTAWRKRLRIVWILERLRRTLLTLSKLFSTWITRRCCSANGGKNINCA